MNAFLHSIRGHPICYPPRSEQNKLVSEEYRSVLHFQGRISVVLIFKERGSCSQAKRSDGQTLWCGIASPGMVCTWRRWGRHWKLATGGFDHKLKMRLLWEDASQNDTVEENSHWNSRRVWIDLGWKEAGARWAHTGNWPAWTGPSFLLGNPKFMTWNAYEENI